MEQQPQYQPAAGEPDQVIEALDKLATETNRPYSAAIAGAATMLIKMINLRAIATEGEKEPENDGECAAGLARYANMTRISMDISAALSMTLRVSWMSMAKRIDSDLIGIMLTEAFIQNPTLDRARVEEAVRDDALMAAFTGRLGPVPHAEPAAG